MPHKGSIRRETAFRVIQSNKSQRLAKWGIFSYTKTGELYKTPSATASTQEEALKISALMSELNNKDFTVRPL